MATKDTERFPLMRWPRHGYAEAAQFMSRDQDHASTIVKRFDHLANRNILFLQSKLAVMQAKLVILDHEDSSTTKSRLKCANCYEDFEEAGGEERWKLAGDIQKTIKEYHEAVLLHSQMLNMNKPAKRTISAFKDWYNGKTKGGEDRRNDGNPQFRGAASRIYDDEDDLVALIRPLDEDPITKFVESGFGWILGSTRPIDGVFYVSRKRIGKWVTAIGAIASMAFLVGAMWWLFAVDHTVDAKMKKKLGIVTGFVVGFSLWVGMLTNARRAEIFAAAAAYVAVLVVFISQQ